MCTSHTTCPGGSTHPLTSLGHLHVLQSNNEWSSKESGIKESYQEQTIFLTQIQLRADEDTTSNQELGVNGVCLGIGGELKEERSDNSGSWRIGAVHTTMSLVEQGVVVWQQRIADTKDLFADGSD